MAERLAEDLWRLDIPLVGNPLKNLNSYLLTGERSLLIDTGFRQQSCREAMERQLAETHVDRDRLDIFCTHLHSDHTGLAPELIRPGCRIYIGEIDSPGVKNASDPSCWKRLYGEYVRDGFTQAEMEALWGDNPAQTAAPPWREGLYTELQDGAALHYGGRMLRCVLTPGHTPGHLCLYELTTSAAALNPEIEGYQALLAQEEKFAAPRPAPLDRETRERAEDRAETGDLRQRTAELKAHHARRLEDTLRTVEKAPGLTAYQIAGRMRWSIRCRNWADFPLAQKFFAVGEALAHLDHLEAQGRVFRQEIHGKRVYFAGVGDKI